MFTMLYLVACGGTPESAALAPTPEVAPAEATPAEVAPPPAEEAAPKDFVVRRTAFRFPGGVTAVALDPALPTESEVSVIPIADLVPAITRTVGTRDGKRRLLPIEHDTWKKLTLPGHTENGPFEVVILWPASPGATRIDPAAVTGLPDTVPAATRTAAVDRDGDGSADLVWSEPACAAPPCGELWELRAGAWKLREKLAPLVDAPAAPSAADAPPPAAP